MIEKENISSEEIIVENAQPRDTTEGDASSVDISSAEGDSSSEGVVSAENDEPVDGDEPTEDAKEIETAQQESSVKEGKFAVITKAVKDKLSSLNRKHLYWIGGVAALLIAGIIAFVVLSKKDDGDSKSPDEENPIFRGDKDDVLEDPENGFGINDTDSTKNESAENKPSSPTSPRSSSRRTPTSYRPSSPSSNPRPSSRPGSNQNASQHPRRALLIGLGEQQDSSWYDLNNGRRISGDTDVMFVKETLKACGYDEANIRTLVNEEAKKDSIVKAFEELAAQCGKGDIVYIHFSGHGQRVKDQNGDEKKDDERNEDLYDESWIPYDAYLRPNMAKDYGNKHLIDDEINLLLNKIVDKIGGDGRLMVVADACHSGSSTRGDGLEDGDSIMYRGGGNFIPPLDLKLKMPGPVRWIAVSACQANEVNQELKVIKDNKPQQVGKLSYAICSILETNETITDSTIVDFFKDKKNLGSLPQNPVIESNKMTYSISDVLK